MTTDEIQPIAIDIPLDVQRLIFEEAAHLSTATAKTLLVLCKFVHPWIAAVLYESVVLSSLKSCIHFSKTCVDIPESFFATRVKALCFSSSASITDITQALKRCPKVRFLSIWNADTGEDPLLAYTVSQLHLTRVSIGSALFATLSFNYRPVFPYATHFELALTQYPGDVLLSTLMTMPALTHICVSWMFPATSTSVVSLLAALTQKPTLEVILFLYDIPAESLGQWFFECTDEHTLGIDWIDGSHDNRVVFGSEHDSSEISRWICPVPDKQHYKDWLYRVPEGYRGLWETAEDMIASRTRASQLTP